jgi:hypothetical protein
MQVRLLINFPAQGNREILDSGKLPQVPLVLSLMDTSIRTSKERIFQKGKGMKTCFFG